MSGKVTGVGDDTKGSKMIRFLMFGIFFIILFSRYTDAQNAVPVIIAFDGNSERVDLVTNEELPNYTTAERGSFQFFLYRLDDPHDYIEFYHDGVNQAKIGSLEKMEKVQQQFAIWRLFYKNGSKNTPRIHNIVVSFIPLASKKKKSENRVYVLLNDLELIEWGK